MAKTTDKQRSDYEGTVVAYNERLWLCWSLNNVQKAQLLTTECIKYSGTPNIENVEILYKLPCVIRNGNKYFYSKKREYHYLWS